ncbi:helix-turn-helix transcriptional regulator [Falsiroseomonas oryzae]|uniref:helix-turn-helix transcriptional regulator n=1 Tax=Falsiroseomonas oryzae TaxID=2766473 RepID=UPI0022EB660D|nr:WYL domain-containing protein [Roseomonas sp. MO-31]
MPRHTDNLIRLAEALQENAEGLTLVEIQRRFAVSESTARNLLRDAQDYFGNIVPGALAGRAKRWRMLPGATRHLIAFTPEELAELDRAEARLRKEGVADGAAAVGSLRRKIRMLTTQRAEDAQRIRLETLMELEADVMRPGPRPELPAGLIEKLRAALVERRVVTLRYKSRFKSNDGTVELEPHGILFGTRHYLVAFAPGDTTTIPRLYAMTNMSDVAVTSRKFQPRAGFDLAAFAARSFGIFQEEPFEVVWRFAPQRAADVLQHHFHPTERKRVLEDGSVEVTFTAGGELEMCWHLFTWGADVEVVAPKRLRQKYAQELRAALGRLSGAEKSANPVTD